MSLTPWEYKVDMLFRACVTELSLELGFRRAKKKINCPGKVATCRKRRSWYYQQVPIIKQQKISGDFHFVVLGKQLSSSKKFIVLRKHMGYYFSLRKLSLSEEREVLVSTYHCNRRKVPLFLNLKILRVEKDLFESWIWLIHYYYSKIFRLYNPLCDLIYFFKQHKQWF
jgi:hypothetical protein